MDEQAQRMKAELELFDQNEIDPTEFSVPKTRNTNDSIAIQANNSAIRSSVESNESLKKNGGKRKKRYGVNKLVHNTDMLLKNTA